MTGDAKPPTRRLKASLLGLGLDSDGGPRRVLTGRDSLVVGGSADTHAELAETMLRLEGEIERLGRGLAEMHPDELADVACRIDCPELLDIAFRIKDELEARGLVFESTSAAELTRIAVASPI